jgi:hypothetical protein
MISITRVLLGLFFVAGLTMVAWAEEKGGKEETIKGSIVCTKCELGETDDCAQAIKTKIDGKEVVIYFIDKGKKEKYHGKICQGPANGSVTGVVSTKDKKKYITPSKDGVKFE